MADIRATFVSQKISKIRWKNIVKNSLEGPDTFVTGSWDDEENKVCLWKVNREKKFDEGDGRGTEGDVDNDPIPICEASHIGDVTGLEFISEDHIVSSSSSGTVTLYKHHTSSQTLGNSHQWERLHHHCNKPCPCTCLAVREDCIITAGEDGRINVLNIAQKDPNRTIGKADSCTVNGVIFLKQFEFLTVNSTGQLKIYDLRSKSDDPAQTLSVTGDLTPLQCVDKHPSQSHIVATGGDDGTLGIWDLRHDKFPVSLMEAHSSTVWELKFHKTSPDHLFTCSDDGSLWHWDSTQINSFSMAAINHYSGTGAGSGGGSLPSQTTVNPWLETEIAKNKMEITSLLSDKSLPINSLDITGHALLCGNDGETIFTLNLPALR
ncbi:nucleoporin Nup43-like [Mytilus trossulus]|uniref:nucleoporin Nup43-like n=1 Tax=Mytilus trossulus TaxID=6551 RepID=UPI0030076508